MGGHWAFYIKSDSVASLDLEKYHSMLREIKMKVQQNPDQYESVVWASSESDAAESNIFATFSYSCDRHSWHGERGPCWKLFWDPLQVPGKDRFSDIHARCQPGPDLEMTTARYDMQASLVRAFPDVFELTLADGISGYDDPFDDGADVFGWDGTSDEHDSEESLHGREDSSEDMFTPEDGYYMTGQGDMVFAFRGEQRDFTACDKDCGYCGRCQY
ncbi:unnamed protein product [Symbiodinium natans]|uniref:Uncharacterized protein n=1 Tax=Symbiodinium natans TaxID=878477 RepID=A0A812SWC5_9DINO|nr:unnamed protein product [Symbiodinium natans]